MFTGIIEEIGTISSLKRIGDGLILDIGCQTILSDVNVGDSISISGVCLTVLSYNNQSFQVEVVAETMAKSILNDLAIGDNVNLERSLRFKDRLGGHFVQGHVDGIGKVKSIENRAQGLWLTITVPSEIARYIVEKGSIAIDGVSLTIAAVNDKDVSIAIISHTANTTILGRLHSGAHVNIETDVIGKYVEKLITPYSSTFNLTLENLQEMGF